MRRPFSTALLLSLLPACPRRTEAPRPPPEAGVSSRPIALDPPHDAAVGALLDVPIDRPVVVIRGPWQRLPLARWTDPARLGRWDDAPDFDGDNVPDEVFAMDARLVSCEPAHRDVPCPSIGVEDGGGDADDGPARVALIARFSADVDTASTTGRLFGLQRVWRSRSAPTSRIDAVRFGDFGRGVSVRTTLLVDHGAGLRDTVDRVDLYLGTGLDRPAGTLVHHCLRTLDGTFQRAGPSRPRCPPRPRPSGASPPRTPSPAARPTPSRSTPRSARRSPAGCRCSSCGPRPSRPTATFASPSPTAAPSSWSAPLEAATAASRAIPSPSGSCG
ncbi:MAG: hypothetical protein IPN17_35915 [Deltaproteobacteria bacterium]|nr:hypothetical protein [Deltaproteobacteria bacterium]